MGKCLIQTQKVKGDESMKRTGKKRKFPATEESRKLGQEMPLTLS